ncbi:FHA domain-containing protein [Pedococcus cremeus]|uniref:FHA domain-containing protein n=1 Tax=Pedococcus cremeus TaxID=587636 RepID=A0A1H9W3J6_9MICO|nr:FHA domain-containing protein [Pedococcus cremeus]
MTVQEQRGWSSITAAGLHVLVRWDAAAPQLPDLRRAASSGDLDEVLDVLAGAGVRSAPDFVAVQEGTPARVVVRGSAYAAVSAPTGEVTVRATGRGPWADEDAPGDATGIDLRTGEPEPEPAPVVPAPAATPAPATPAPAQPAPSGWRLPSRLGRGRSADPEPAASTAHGSDAEEVEELPSYDHLFGATQHGRPDPAEPRYIEPHDTDSISEPGIGQAPVAAAGGFTEPTSRSDQTLPPPTDTAQVRPSAPPQAQAFEPPRQPPAPPAAPTAVPPPTPGGLIDSVPWRSGGTNIAPPEPPQPAHEPGRPAHEPARPPDQPAHPVDQPAHPAPPEGAPSASSTQAPAPTPLRPAGVHTPPPAPTLRPMAPPPAPVADPAPPTRVPEPAATEALEEDDADDAEATVDRSALLAAQQVESGPLVPAVLCPAGHPSPPHAGTCRTCGRDIPPQQPFQTARPPLGVLRLATGDVVTLDRGVLLGRSPKVRADLPAADRPHLVKVPSPENDISRNHLEVVLEGWHVLVRDLGSTNGTTVALPGQVPVRLRPGDQQVIEPGTILTMADEVSLTFEVGA